MCVITYLSKLTECPTPRVNPNLNYGLWVIMICQCRFISCNKCATLVGDFENGRRYACWRAGGILEFSVPSIQFCSEPKTAFKNRVY